MVVEAVGEIVVGHHHNDLQGARIGVRASRVLRNGDLKRARAGRHVVGDHRLRRRPYGIREGDQDAARGGGARVGRHGIRQGRRRLRRAGSLSERHAIPPGVRDGDRHRDRDRRSRRDMPVDDVARDVNRGGGFEGGIGRRGLRARGLLLRVSDRVLLFPAHGCVEDEVRARRRRRE